jgi:hypothetical protein
MVMKRFTVLCTPLVLTLFLVGCGAPRSKVASDADILATINENLIAMQREDADATMATIDESSPAYASTKDMLGVIFNQYDLKYELSDLKVIEKNSREAKVSFTQVTRKVSGPEFQDNKITGVHTLHFKDGKWKIFGSTITSTEHLN